jgi:hypothetical protein
MSATQNMSLCIIVPNGPTQFISPCFIILGSGDFEFSTSRKATTSTRSAENSETFACLC